MVIICQDQGQAQECKVKSQKVIVGGQGGWISLCFTLQRSALFLAGLQPWQEILHLSKVLIWTQKMSFPLPFYSLQQVIFLV